MYKRLLFLFSPDDYRPSSCFIVTVMLILNFMHCEITTCDSDNKQSLILSYVMSWCRNVLGPKCPEFVEVRTHCTVIYSLALFVYIFVDNLILFVNFLHSCVWNIFGVCFKMVYITRHLYSRTKRVIDKSAHVEADIVVFDLV